MTDSRTPKKDPLIQLAELDYAAARLNETRERSALLTSVLSPLLEALNGFFRCYEALGDKATLPRSTVDMIARRILSALEEAGIEIVPAMGHHADPRVHEIVGTKSVPSVPSDTIVEELSRGYRLRGELLQRPKVIAAVGGKSGDRTEDKS